MWVKSKNNREKKNHFNQWFIFYLLRNANYFKSEKKHIFPTIIQYIIQSQIQYLSELFQKMVIFIFIFFFLHFLITNIIVVSLQYYYQKQQKKQYYYQKQQKKNMLQLRYHNVQHSQEFNLSLKSNFGY
eukprot:TRINITY_DN12212_c0_g1_i1.p4 TRINITY_DN12212_c0_g1~~TRINITY_DN12212_c0_g1_i1.p4  ORF type:complete len:129 (-),score=3.06 TRINITY_DN12212_c0_g1_i1:326-712(-)